MTTKTKSDLFFFLREGVIHVCNSSNQNYFELEPDYFNALLKGTEGDLEMDLSLDPRFFKS